MAAVSNEVVYLVVDVFDDAVPEYAVLSHTWGQEEVTFQDLQGFDDGWLNLPGSKSRKVAAKNGFSKTQAAAELASQDGYCYIWIDTCCIDKTSSAELSEAINSMYRWYEQAAVCYVYLSDVEPITEENILNGAISERETEVDETKFRRSRWFTRGWTLQELLAPKDVIFYTKDWTFIGNKSNNIKLQNLLSSITGIDARVLNGLLNPQDLSISTRMKWASMRKTSRLEDIAYCLMGLFGVNMPLLYGEGRRAFIRLQEEILKETDDQSLFAWISEREDGQTRDSLSGLLAESPLRFKNVGNFRPLPPLTTRDSVPSSTTNQGLRVQLYLVPAIIRHQANFKEEYQPETSHKEDYHTEEYRPEERHAEEYHAILDCSVIAGNLEYCPAIYLRRLWGDQFARVLPSESELVLPPAEDANPNHKGYQTIYVKQRPVYILPEFSPVNRDIRFPGATSDHQAYVFEEVYPSDRWNPNSLSLKSNYSRLDQVQGVFRFCHPYILGVKVDVAVGLRRAKKKGWESWCSQRCYCGDSLDFVFEYFKQTLTPPDYNISLREKFDERLQRLGEGQMILSQAKVIETQTHGRSYIYLQVIAKPEIDTSKELQFWPHNPGSELFKGRATDEFKAALRKLTVACCVDDTANFSVVRTADLKKKVRTTRNTSQFSSSFIDALQHLLSSFSLSQLTVRDPPSRVLSWMERELSIALLYACKEGDLGPIAYLLQRGALIEAETENFHSFRPIHWAAIGGHSSVVHFLLRAGAQDYSVTSGGWTTVHIAAMMGHVDILVQFLKNSKPAGLGISNVLHGRTTGTLESPLHLAAAYVLPDAVDQIFNALYAPGNPARIFAMRFRNYLGESPLHRAAAADNARALLRYLSDKTGAFPPELHSVDSFSRSPLWHAACAGSSDSVSALFAQGASLDLADEVGRTPLHAACREGRTDAVRTLLELGANPNIGTHPPGLTPCHYAALFGHKDCLRLLIQHKAKADACTTQLCRFKPIHLAAANGWLECVQILLAATCDPGGHCTHYIVIGKDRDATIVARSMISSEALATFQGHLKISKLFNDQRVERDDLAIVNGPWTLRGV